MIFREYMSKPAIHFARFQFFKERYDYIVTLSDWSKGDIRSGHVSSDILHATYWVARDVAITTAVNPSLIKYHRYHGGTKRVDVTTDLICFVHTGPQFLPFDVHMGHRPSMNYERVFESVGRIRRGGLLVTRQMWYEVLENWFLPLPAAEADRVDQRRLRSRGPLGNEHLATLMMCFSVIQFFSLVLTDVTEDDWNEYYAALPIAFHDHTGSYVDAYEEPLHPAVVGLLWKTGDEKYPYPANSEPNLVKDLGFGRRVDRQLSPRQRISMLLGLLTEAGETASGWVESLRDLEICVLVRKPASLSESSVGCTAPEPATEDADDHLDVVLGPGDTEAKWVKQALGRIMHDSAEAYVEEGEMSSDLGTASP
jgi:hypothetical protein